MNRTVANEINLSSSDEDDVINCNEDEFNHSDIEGEENGMSRNVGKQSFTAFNILEELEEGYFDKNKHFIWKKDDGIRDNWLSSVDEQEIKIIKCNTCENVRTEPFDENELYKQILTYMNPSETINNCLKRLGKKYKKLSSIERLRQKKAGLSVSNDEVIELTELANKILSETGNVDIYEETYEEILKKIGNAEIEIIKEEYR